MGITYKGFRHKLAEYNIRPSDIAKETGISNGVFTKMNNDEYVSLSTLEVICKYFRDKYNDGCTFGDLIDYKSSAEK